MTDDLAHAVCPAADQTTTSGKDARSWFWIFLLLFLWVYGIRTGASMLFVLTDLSPMALSATVFMYPVQIIGVAIVPTCLAHFHLLDNWRTEKRLLVALLLLSIAIMAVFVFVEGIALHLILLYVMILCPSVGMGIALRHGALLWREEKSALYIGMAYAAHIACAQLEYYSFFATGSVVFYLLFSYVFFIGLLLAVIVLALRLRDDHSAVLPPVPHVYPKRFARSMAVLLVVHAFFSTAINTVIYFDNMDDFHTPGYELFFYALAILVVLGAVCLFYRGKWLAPTLVCLLLLCFGQGLSLFGIESMPLAVTYNLTTMIGKMPPFVLSLILPVHYAIGKRKPGFACMGYAITFSADFLLLSTQLSEENLWDLMPGHARQGVLLLIGLCLIGAVFYLYARFERTRTDALRRMIQEGRRERRSTRETVDSLDLTAREKEVTALLLAGDSQKIVAAKLGVRLPTVSFHIRNVYRKLHIQSKAELFSLFLAVEPTDAA